MILNFLFIFHFFQLVKQEVPFEAVLIIWCYNTTTPPIQNKWIMGDKIIICTFQFISTPMNYTKQ